jgi:hypothetical protein
MTDKATLPRHPHFWPKKMSRNGQTVGDHDMAIAWKAWASSGDLTCGRLAVCLRQTGRPFGPTDRLDRISDAMLQHARKAGFITYKKGCWHLMGGAEE